MGYKIFSDFAMSDTARALWNSLEKNGQVNVSIMDIHTGEKFPIDQAGIAKTKDTNITVIHPNKEEGDNPTSTFDNKPDKPMDYQRFVFVAEKRFCNLIGQILEDSIYVPSTKEEKKMMADQEKDRISSGYFMKKYEFCEPMP